MFTVTRALEEALLRHFMCQKLEIAYAINKPFPFFEALRDKSFITERTYRESLEACTNMVPVSKVVHNVLTKLEKTFNLSLLVTLFSQINLREYPNLMEIFRSFKSVGASYGEWSRTTASLEAPGDPAAGSSLKTPLLPPASRPPPPRPLPRAPGIRKPRAALQQTDETPKEPPSPSDPALPPPGRIREGRSTPGAKSNITAEVSEEDSRETRSPPPGAAQVIRNDSPEQRDPEEPQEAGSVPPKRKGNKRKRNIWSTPKRKRQKKSCPGGTVSPGYGTQKKPPVEDQTTPRKDRPTCNLKMLTRSQKTRATGAQKPRSEENPGDDTADFLSPTLPVTCGQAKGILYKEKMKRGSSEKSIRDEDGAWFTPIEFAKEGLGGVQKNWRRSVHCRGKSLRQLLEKGFLLCPPRVNLKKAVNCPPRVNLKRAVKRR